MRKYDKLPLCDECQRKISRFRYLPDRLAQQKVHRAIATIMCAVISRRGIDAGYESAIALWQAVNPVPNQSPKVGLNPVIE
ncbi:MAG: hypothetical protein E4H01_04480 [Lysobacterales bacterium]|nr:MAG: hypothetical protein E4H01_04480 [Xanthomonadales bacterium]